MVTLPLHSCLTHYTSTWQSASFTAKDNHNLVYIIHATVFKLLQLAWLYKYNMMEP